MDRVIGSIGSEIHSAAPEGDSEDDTTASTAGLPEDARGDSSDVTQHIHGGPEGHFEDEEITRTGVIASSGSVVNMGGPEKGQEQDGPVARAGTTWEDSEEILEVPRTPLVHGCFENRVLP